MTLSFGQNTSSNEFDVIIRGGTVYDGSGGKPYKAMWVSRAIS
jgi:N-acyl-D-aspartate/D-glutamate deacylase